MNLSIKIDPQKCSKCGKCVKICPSVIFFINDKKSIQTQCENSCIGCGHCVCVCQDDAISHNLFPKSAIHPFNKNDYPTSDSLNILMKSRRSNRSMGKTAIPKEKLNAIIDAAYRAPTASNKQGLEFTLVQNEKNLKLITQFTLDVFGQIIKLFDNIIVRPIVKRTMPGVYRYVPTLKKIGDQYYNHGNDLILRNATAVLLISAPKNSQFGAEDTNLALQNASLMAQSLGVANIYMGFVLTATRQKKGKLEKKLGINGKIGAILALGIPNVQYVNYVDRNPVIFNQL